MPNPPARTADLWTIIIPVKDTGVAKTRLSSLDQPTRATLAIAFALDAATAASACSLVRRVVAVTNDPLAGKALAAVGADIVADLPGAGQNRALEHAFAVVRRDDPAASVAAMSADLPALRPDDLALALTLGTGFSTWFVADADGTGTTLLGASRGATLSPAFGGRSRERHSRLGAVEIDAPGLDRLRRDVDTESHLSDALRLGVGPHTREAVAHLDVACTS